jgi:hypothetical protein
MTRLSTSAKPTKPRPTLRNSGRPRFKGDLKLQVKYSEFRPGYREASRSDKQAETDLPTDGPPTDLNVTELSFIKRSGASGSPSRFSAC